MEDEEKEEELDESDPSVFRVHAGLNRSDKGTLVSLKSAEDFEKCGWLPSPC